MIDWDDVRYFLAAARGGSVRAAAKRLGVNHATVLRRIAQLEERLGAQMFEKQPSGYRLTAAGEEVLELANHGSVIAPAGDAGLRSSSQSARGLLRVTLPPFLATHLLMPDFADFRLLYPDIEMEILSSGALANLTNREADVAIRIISDRKTLPLNLHGLKGPDLFGGVYIVPAIGWPRGGARRIHRADRHRQIMEFQIGPTRARSVPRTFRSGARTPRCRSLQQQGSG